MSKSRWRGDRGSRRRLASAVKLAGRAGPAGRLTEWPDARAEPRAVGGAVAQAGVLAPGEARARAADGAKVAIAQLDHAGGVWGQRAELLGGRVVVSAEGDDLALAVPDDPFGGGGARREIHRHPASRAFRR